MRNSNNISKNNPKNENLDHKVTFNKKELGVILSLYGKMVSMGEWRDYGISMLKDLSIFSIYKHNAEFPIYMVKKNSFRNSKVNIFSVVAMDGKIITQGNNLETVLNPLKLKLIRRVK